MKKKQLLVPLLMALVMIAMCPMRMWAEGVKPSGDGTEESPFLLEEDGNFEWLVAQGNSSANKEATFYAKMMADYSTTDMCFEFRYGTWVLDLNGHTAKTTDSYGMRLWGTSSSNLNVTIKDSSIDHSGCVQSAFYAIYVMRYTSLTIEGGTFTAGFYGLTTQNADFTSITLRGGTFTNTGDVSAAFSCSSWDKVDYTGYRFVDVITGEDAEIKGDFVESNRIKLAKPCTFNADDICTDCGKGKPAVYNEEKNVYEISNGGQLLWFNRQSLTKDMNAELMADITINTQVLKADGSLNGKPAYEWIVPNYYLGTFDGKNHTISGIYCQGIHRDGTVNNNIAMFGQNTGTICNVTVKDSYFGNVENKARVATFAGDNKGKITDCSSFATIKGRSFCGGIAGDCRTADICNCLYAGVFYPDDENSGPICSDRTDVDITDEDVHNNYFLNTCLSGDNVVVRSTSVTLDELKSGKVAVLLQAGREKAVWGQNLSGESKDTHPVLGGAAIYFSKTLCDGKTMASDAEFSNTAYENPVVAPHAYGEDVTHQEVSCTDDGYDLQVCSACGYKNKINLVAAQGHADADKDGMCDACGDVIAAEPVLVTEENCEALGLDARYIGYKAISNLAQLAGFAEQMGGAIKSASAAFKLGPNKVSVNANESILKPFTPTQTGRYTFDMGTDRTFGLCLYASKEDYENDNAPLVWGFDECTYICQQKVTYYLMVFNQTSLDMTDATLSITVENAVSTDVDEVAKGPNTVTVVESKVVLFRPTTSGTYSFTLSGTALQLFASNPLGATVTPSCLVQGAGSIEYDCEVGKDYYLGIVNRSESAITDATLAIQKTSSSSESKVARKASGLDFRPHGPQASIDKYVLADNIVLNANLLDEDGMPQINDVDGKPRTMLLWTSPSLGLYYEGSGNETLAVVFDGNGHTISGIFQQSEYMMGLFSGITPHSVVTNLGVTDSYFYASDGNVSNYEVSSIAAYSCGTIANCWSDATLDVQCSDHVGGLVGYLDGGEITGSSYSGKIYLQDEELDASGIASVAETNLSDVEISDCHFSGKVIVNDQYCSVTGLVGEILMTSGNTFDMERCYADGEVVINGDYSSVYGLAASISDGGYYLNIRNCYNAMTIDKASNAMYRMIGLLGYIEGPASTVGSSMSACFSYGDYSDAVYYDPIYDSCSAQDFSIHGVFYLYNEGSQNNQGSGSGMRSVNAFAPDGPLPAELFASGALACMLNEYTGGSSNDEPVLGPPSAPRKVESSESEEPAPVWYQEIGVDKYPVLKGDKFTVVYYDESEKRFYNLEPALDEYELADGTQYDLKRQYKVGELTYTRNFEGTHWTTWYVPFELELTDGFCDKFAFARINNVHQYDTDDDGMGDETVVESFCLKSGCTLKANYPYLVKARTDADKTMNIQLDDAVLYAAEENSIDCHSVDYNYIFVGTYKGIGQNQCYGNMFTLFDDSRTEDGWQNFLQLAPQRHFLCILSRNGNAQDNAGIREVKMMVMGDEDATGVVHPYSDEQKQAETYDLTGRRIAAGTQQAGVRITNGKKIMVK